MTGYVQEIYKVYYTAKDFIPSLNDVRLIEYKPDGTHEGVFTLTELNATAYGKGVYYYEYTPQTVGEYLFVVDSVSNPRRFAKSMTFIEKSNRIPYINFDN